MLKIIDFLVNRDLIVNLVSIFLILLGGFTAISEMNREAFPNVNLDKIQISIAQPGATPEEVERLIITPIEQELKALDGIDTMNSVAFPGSGRIELELDPAASNRSRIASEIQLAIDRADLPSDMPFDPVILEIDGRVFPVIQLAVSAPISELELKRLGDRIEDDLLVLPGIARVQIQGSRKAEIRIIPDVEKLKRYRITIGEISDLLRRWNVNAPGGEVQTATGQKIVRIAGEFIDAEDVRSLVLRANERGSALRIADVAEVVESLEKAERYYDVAGKPALNMIVLKKSGSDIIDTVNLINAYLETVPAKYGAHVQVDSFQDFSEFTRLRLGVLTNNGMVGLVLVFVTLIIFLRPSVALTTTIGLPIVFLTGLYVLYLAGVTLNLVSMLGFIMVLGMLVDDAIIIGENITYHMEKGMRPRQAASVGALELIGPVTATVLTSVAAFLPLMFMSGVIGKFIVAIPAVVITLLLFSWLESFLILPSHVAYFANSRAHPRQRRWLTRLEDFYAEVLAVALKYKWITILIGLLILAASIVLAKNKLSFQLFPSTGVDQYIVRVVGKPGTSLETMRQNMLVIERHIREAVPPENLETTITTTGQTANDENDPLLQRGSRYGQVRVLYTPAVLRPDHDATLEMNNIVRELADKFPEFSLAGNEIKPGPPTGRPLEVEIAGNDEAASEAVARRLLSLLARTEGVTNVETGIAAGDDEIHVVLDRTLAAYTGVDLATAANHIRAALDGLRVTTTRRAQEEVDVTIRLPDRADKFEALRQLYIPNRQNQLVKLAEISTFEEHQGYSSINHKAGVRVVRVIADVNNKDMTSLKLNKLVRDSEANWVAGEGDRVSINYGGENEKNQESFRDLAKSMVYALLGIFFILAIQFNNLMYPLAVMVAIPFGIVGIIFSFYLHDLFWKPMPLSFFSTMGMVALTGVVVNSSLILIVFIQRQLQEGVETTQAIIEAGRRRLRAVILTASTTVVGLLPTAYGWGGMDPFVSPMALALSWGLAFSTLVTLLLLPAVMSAGISLRQNVLTPFWQRLLRRPRPSV
ncbi:MAG: efflux RND transporter permease subunit [Gammaproteobacteria bacterium]